MATNKTKAVLEQENKELKEMVLALKGKLEEIKEVKQAKKKSLKDFSSKMIVPFKRDGRWRIADLYLDFEEFNATVDPDSIRPIAPQDQDYAVAMMRAKEFIVTYLNQLND